VALAEGRWPGRLRRAAPLALPLLGSSLERGLDVAEAMTARGYGSGPRTRVAEPAWTGVERAVLAIGAALAALTAAAIALGLAGYSYYPTMDAPWAPGAIAVAAGALAALAGAAAVLRR
jgi:energy-coupling factor transport system permease protein